MPLPKNEIFTETGPHRYTAMFFDWKLVMDLLTDWAVNVEGRSTSKDAMAAIQLVIIGCREQKKFQRDPLPDSTIVSVSFPGGEHTVAQMAMIRVLKGYDGG